jgi:hypothetical protein
MVNKRKYLCLFLYPFYLCFYLCLFIYVRLFISFFFLVHTHTQVLKTRLQSAEGRSEELASSLPDTTRPLLRQIELLQTANNDRIKIWNQLGMFFLMFVFPYVSSPCFSYVFIYFFLFDYFFFFLFYFCLSIYLIYFLLF